MRLHVLLPLLVAVPGAALPAQAVHGASARADSAVRLVSAAYLRASTAPAPTRAAALGAMLRLADSVVTTLPTSPAASQVALARGLAGLALSRELRAAAARTGLCLDAQASRAEATAGADAVLAGARQLPWPSSARAARLAHTEDDSTRWLVARLCQSASRTR